MNIRDCLKGLDRAKLLICKQEPPHCQHLILPLVSYRMACHRERKACNFFLFSELWEHTFLVGTLCCWAGLILKSAWTTQTRLLGFFKKEKADK